jgi:hypothetical protein
MTTHSAMYTHKIARSVVLSSIRPFMRITRFIISCRRPGVNRFVPTAV